MTISAKQSGQLQVFFSELSETQQQTLVMTIKAAKADGEALLPYDELLSLLGGETIEEDRWKEIFSVVEPLVAKTANGCNQIELALLRDVWEYYLRELNPENAAAWLSGHESLENIRESMVLTFAKLKETKKGRQALQTRFGEDKAYQIDMLLSLLRRANELEDFFAGWEDTIKSLDDGHLFPLRDFNEHLIVESPEITPYLLFLVTSHLLHPFHVFRAIEKVTGHSNDRVMIKTELKSVGDALLDLNDMWLKTFVWEHNQQCDTEVPVESLKSFINLTSGWISEFDIDPSGLWGKRLASQKSRCGKAWDAHMDRIKKSIDQVLPRKRGSVTGRQTMPDIHKDIDENKVALAVNAIELLVAARPFASQGGFQSSKDKAVQMLESRLEEQSDDLLALLGQDQDDYSQVSAHFAVLVRITKAYLGSKDADILARRSIAAMAA